MGSGPSTRNVVRIALAVGGTALALYLVYLLRGVLELVVLAIFLALWLGPFVELLQRRRVSRVVAILATYLTLFPSLVFLGLVAVPSIVSEIQAGVRPAGRSQVSGMLVLISVLAGATLANVVGARLAIPVAAAIQIVVRDMWQQRQEALGNSSA